MSLCEPHRGGSPGNHERRTCDGTGAPRHACEARVGARGRCAQLVRRTEGTEADTGANQPFERAGTVTKVIPAIWAVMGGARSAGCDVRQIGRSPRTLHASPARRRLAFTAR